MSRFKNNYQIGEFANPESGDAYFFYPHALEKGILDIDQLDPNEPHQAAMMIRNGKIPAQAGTIALRGDSVAAYDLVSGKLDGNDLRIGPSHKNSVDRQSRNVLSDGLLTLSYADGGLVKVIAEISNANTSEWNVSYRNMGAQAIKYLGVDAPVFEVEEILSEVTIAKPRRPIFSVSGLLK